MSTSNERDRSVERLLQGSFKHPDAGVTDACLDAETLAAFSDGGLTGEALEIAQVHLADCARCQAILGAAVRVRTIARDPEPVRAGRGWLAWLVPLTAGAAAVALWVAVTRTPDTPPPSQLEARNEAPQAKTAAPPQFQPSPDLKEQEQASEKRNDRPARDRDATPTPSLRKDGDVQELDRLKQETPSDRSAPLADQSAPAAPPAAAPPTAAPARRDASDPQAAGRAAEKLDAFVVSSQAGDVRWRLARTALERSQDGGVTWTAVATGVSGQLTAISAPSPTACWVVGRGGVVLRSIDGQSFSRVPFPLTTDLSGVQAVNAQTAVVTTTEGRVFRTSDGGATWRGQ